MANRYWVGGTGTWNTTSTTKWATTSGGTAGASVPTATDDVIFDSNSGSANYTVTLTGALNCLSLTVGAPSSGAVTFTSSGTINNRGSFSIAASQVWNATGVLTFSSITSGNTITTNGVSLACPITLNGVAGTWTLGSALTLGNTRAVTMTNGSLNLGGYTLTCGLFLCTLATTGRTLTFGGGQINITGDAATVINLGGKTAAGQLTIVGDPIFNLTNASAVGTRTLTFTGIFQGTTVGLSDNYMELNVTAGGGVVSLPAAGLSFWKNLRATSGATAQLSFVNTSGDIIGVAGALELNTGQFPSWSTVTTLRMGSNTIASTIKSSAPNYFPTTIEAQGLSLTLLSNIAGSFGMNIPYTLDLNGFTLTASGSFDYPSLFITGPYTLAFGTTGSLVISSNTTSGGTVLYLWDSGSEQGATITGTPTILITIPSGSALSQTFSIGPQPTVNLTLNFSSTGVSTSTFTSDSSNSVGSLLMTVTAGQLVGQLTGTLGVSGNTTLLSSTQSSLTLNTGAGLLTTNGASGFNLSCNGTTLQDALSVGALSSSTGTFNVNNQNISCTSFSSSSGTVNMGSGTWTITGSGASAWNCSGALTLNANTSTINMTSASAKTFAGGGKTYNVLNQGGAGALTLTGNNTFADITNSVVPCTVRFTAGSNNTFTAFSLHGTSGNLVTITSPTAAQHTLTKAGGGIIQVGFCNISYSNATPAFTWFAAP